MINCAVDIQCCDVEKQHWLSVGGVGTMREARQTSTPTHSGQNTEFNETLVGVPRKHQQVADRTVENVRWRSKFSNH